MVIPTQKKSSWQRLKIWANVRLSHTEVLMLTKYLSVLLESGLAINDSLQILFDQSKGPMKVIVGTLKSKMEQGRTLAEGFGEFPHIFTPVFINLVAAGEQSGMLRDNLEHLNLQMQKSHDLRSKVKGAMTYPVVILVAALGLSIGIVVFILPNITSVFSTLDVELPVTTRMLLWTAEVFEAHGGLIALGSTILFVGFMFIRTLSFAKPALHTLALKFPMIGGLVQKNNVARLTRVVGTMLDSGMPIAEVVTVTKLVMNNVMYKKFLDSLSVEIGRGRSISELMAENKMLFPPIVTRMTRVGEETGSLGKMMKYLANFYEQELDDDMGNISTLLEPMLLIFIGLMVGIIALSIVSPIYQIVGSLK